MKTKCSEMTAALTVAAILFGGPAFAEPNRVTFPENIDAQSAPVSS